MYIILLWHETNGIGYDFFLILSQLNYLICGIKGFLVVLGLNLIKMTKNTILGYILHNFTS